MYFVGRFIIDIYVTLVSVVVMILHALAHHTLNFKDKKNPSMVTQTVATLCLFGATLATAALSAFIRRSKRLAIFQTIILSIHSISSSLNYLSVLPLPVFVYLNFTVFAQTLSLAKPSLKGTLWRALISFPNTYYSSCTVLWFLFTPISKFFPSTICVPLVLCFLGFLQTVRIKKEIVDIDIVKPTPVFAKLTPLTTGINSHPHLGPLMSPERLRSICECIVDWDPDLVLLTGDNITIESYHAIDGFATGYAPLKKLKGRTFACLGNHDYESLDTVEQAMRAADIQLLKDEEAIAQTAVGPVQIIGTEYSFRKAQERILRVTQKYPRRDNHLRVFLVHNPEEFEHFPDNEADIVFSGHTHGGQLGLYSLGIHWTVYRFVKKKSADFGLWGNGHNRLYVHRGTGHYGFPIRIGVPNELSLLNVYF